MGNANNPIWFAEWQSWHGYEIRAFNSLEEAAAFRDYTGIKYMTITKFD